jgi:hypothetical protein
LARALCGAHSQPATARACTVPLGMTRCVAAAAPHARLSTFCVCTCCCWCSVGARPVKQFGKFRHVSERCCLRDSLVRLPDLPVSVSLVTCDALTPPLLRAHATHNSARHPWWWPPCVPQPPLWKTSMAPLPVTVAVAAKAVDGGTALCQRC